MQIEDFQTAAWQRIEAYLRERLEVFRVRNDAPTMDATSTAHMRGRIAMLKEILALPQGSANEEAGPIRAWRQREAADPFGE